MLGAFPSTLTTSRNADSLGLTGTSGSSGRRDSWWPPLNTHSNSTPRPLQVVEMGKRNVFLNLAVLLGLAGLMRARRLRRNEMAGYEFRRNVVQTYEAGLPLGNR
jgi:hypothetical protein